MKRTDQFVTGRALPLVVLGILLASGLPATAAEPFAVPLALPASATATDSEPESPSPAALAHAALSALRRPYYAQLAGASIPDWAPAYAWQLTALANPVLDPGFESSPPFAWTLTGGAERARGELVLAPGAEARQAFSTVTVPTDPGATQGGIAASSVTGFRGLTLRATAPALASVALVAAGTGEAFTTFDAPLAAGVNHIPARAFAPHFRGVAASDEAVLAAHVASITLTANATTVALDDVILEADVGIPNVRASVDGGPTPALEREWRSAFASTASAHDGVATILFPLADGRILGALVEYGPSGARILAPDVAASRLDGSVAVDGAPTASMAGVASMDLRDTPYASLFAESGLDGEVVGFAPSAAASALYWRATLVAHEPSLYASATAAEGHMNLQKLLDPANPANDAFDLVPDVATAAAASALFADLDGDGFTDAVEIALGSSPTDPHDVPARDSAFSADVSRTVVDVSAARKIDAIRYPLSTLPAFLAPGDALAIEFANPTAPTAATVTLRPSFSALAASKTITLPVADVSAVAYPSSAWPTTATQVWRVNVTLPESVAGTALDRLYDVTVTAGTVTDTQPRAVKLVSAFKTDPVIVVLSDTRVGDPAASTRALTDDPTVVLVTLDDAADGGDIVGGDTPLFARAVAEVNALGPDMVIITGDVTFAHGGFTNHLAAYETAYAILQELDAPTFLAPGELDGFASAGGDGQALWDAFFGPLYTSFDYGTIHGVAINTYDWAFMDRFGDASASTTTGGQVRDTQLAWLAADLARAKVRNASSAFVFGHHSPSSRQDASQSSSIDDTFTPPAIDRASIATYWSTFFGTLASYAPEHAAFALRGIASLSTSMTEPTESATQAWTGANRLALRDTLRAFGVDTFFAGHTHADRVAQELADGRVLEATGGDVRFITRNDADGGAATLSDFDLTDASRVLYIETTTVAGSTREYQGYRVHRLTDPSAGYAITDASLARLAGVPRVWHADQSEIGFYAIPLDQLTVTTSVDVARGEHTVTATSDLDAPMNLTSRVAFTSTTGYVGDALVGARNTRDSTAVLVRTLRDWEDASGFTRELDVNFDAAPHALTDAIVYLDASPPTSALDALPEWTNQQFVTARLASATDDHDLDAVRVEVRDLSNTSGTWMLACDDVTFESPCTIDLARIAEEGDFAFRAIARDYAGHEEAKTFADASTGRDVTAPVSESVLIGPGSTLWYTGPVTSTVACSDARSGCASTVFAREDEFVTDYSTPIVTTANGVHTLSYASRDVAGNVEGTRVVTFRIDATAPTTSLTLASPDGANDWFVTDATLALACEDQSGLSGCALTQYRLNAGPWLTYTTPVTLADGVFDVAYRSTDGAGNVEEARGILIRVDGERPTLTLTSPTSGALTRTVPAIAGTTAFGPSQGRVEVRIIDDATGDAWDGAQFTPNGLILATITGTSWTVAPSAMPLALPDGAYTYRATAVSASGISRTLSASIALDATPPVLSMDALPEWLSQTPADIAVHAADASTIADLELDHRYSSDGAAFGPWTRVITAKDATDATLAFTFPAGDGVYVFGARAQDAAGNSVEGRRVLNTVKVDTRPPDLARTSAASVLASATPHALRFAVADFSGIASLNVVAAANDGVSQNAALDPADPVIPVDLSAATTRVTYTLTATDILGHVSVLTGEVIVLDPSPPTRLDIPVATGENGWYTNTVTATVAIRSGFTGALDVYARATRTGEPASEFVKTTTLTLSGSGTYVIEHGALRAGAPLTELRTQSATVRVDRDAPEGILLAPVTTVGDGQRVMIEASASDATSGVARVSVHATRVDGSSAVAPLALDATGVWRTSFGPFRLGEDPSMRLEITDAAGRVTLTAARSFIVTDDAPPTVILGRVATTVKGAVAVTAQATDANGVTQVAFRVNGVPVATSTEAPYAFTWDTRTTANGAARLTAVATDSAGNTAEDDITVTVANAPRVDALALSQTAGVVDARVEVTAAGGRLPVVTLLARNSSTAPYTAIEMSAPACGASGCGTLAFTSVIPGVQGAGSRVEAYALARDGATSNVSRVTTLTVPVSADAPMSTWRDDADVTFSDGDSETSEHAWIDIVDAQIHGSRDAVTFSMSLAGDFNTSSPARYLVEFRDGEDGPVHAALIANYSAGDPPVVWTAHVQDADSGVVRAAPEVTLGLRAREITYQLAREDFAAIVGDIAPRVHVQFHAFGSEDVTVARLFDFVAPVITHSPASTATTSTALALIASATDASEVAELIATVTEDGVTRDAIHFSDGAASVDALAGGAFTYTIAARDVHGNVREIGPFTVTVTDDSPPVAQARALDALPSVDEGVVVTFTAQESTDDTGIDAYAWDFDDADGFQEEASGRVVTHSFASPGLRVVTLEARDAAGNTGRATVTVDVRDATPPQIRLLSPATGASIVAGATTIRGDASDATSLSRVDVRVDGGAWRATRLHEDGTWEFAWTASEGVHILEARAVDTAGNEARSSQVRVISDASPPVVAFDAASVSVKDVSRIARLAFTADDASPIKQVVWKFGDGTSFVCVDGACAGLPTWSRTTGTADSVAHDYALEGDYVVTVNVTDAVGFASEARVDVRVLAPERTSPSDLSTGSGTSPPHAAPSPAPDPAAPTDPADAPPASVDFRISGPGFTGEPVEFTVTDAAADASYAWDFGDGSSATGAIVTHEFASPGNHTVTLTVAGTNVTRARSVQVTDARTPVDALVDAIVASTGIGRAEARVIANGTARESVIGAFTDADGLAFTLVWVNETALLLSRDPAQARVIPFVTGDSGFIRAPARGWFLGVAETRSIQGPDGRVPADHFFATRGGVIFVANADAAGASYVAVNRGPPDGLVDSDPPTVRVAEAPSGVTASPARIRFEASDGATINWRVRGTDAWTRTSVARVSGDGVVILDYFAEARNGARSRFANLSLTLDDAFPVVVGHTLDPETPRAGAPVRVGLIVEESNLARIAVIVRGSGLPAEGLRESFVASARTTTSFTPPEAGTYTIRVTAIDALGQESVPETFNVRVFSADGTPPANTSEPDESTNPDLVGAKRGTPGPASFLVLAAVFALAFAARRRVRA